MTSDPLDPIARDDHLRAALRHAPDAQVGPSTALSEMILAEARAKAKGSARAPASPWATLWQWLARPSVATGFAGVMVATLVGVMWWGRPLDEAMPRRADAPISMPAGAVDGGDADPAKAPMAAPAPAPSPQAAPATKPSKPEPGAMADAAPKAPAHERAMAPTEKRRAAPDRAPAQPEEQLAKAAEPTLTRERSLAPPTEPPAHATINAAGADRQAPAPAPAPASPAPPVSPALAQSPRPDQRALAGSIIHPAPPPTNLAPAEASRPRAEASNADSALAPVAPPAAAVPPPLFAPLQLHRAIAERGSLNPLPVSRLRAEIAAAPTRWAWQRGSGSAMPVNEAVLAWLSQADSAAPPAAWSLATATTTTSPDRELRLLRDGVVVHRLQLGDAGLQWQHDGRSWQATISEPGALPALRAALEAAAP